MILVIDNYDSFTYNLVQYLGECGARVEVRRNDAITLSEILSFRPEGIMLSPGPCTPSESGVCLDILALALEQENDSANPLRGIPIFGVCLGHQAIGQVSGGLVTSAKTIMHGKTSMVHHDGQWLFEGMPNPFRAIRYHSLSVTKDTVPEDFVITAVSEDDQEVMGLRHKRLPIEGVQFHPESALTENGMRIIENFLSRVRLQRELRAAMAV